MNVFNVLLSLTFFFLISFGLLELNQTIICKKAIFFSSRQDFIRTLHQKTFKKKSISYRCRDLKYAISLTRNDSKLFLNNNENLNVLQ